MSGLFACDQCGACCRKLIVEINHIDVVREPKLATAANVHKEPPWGYEDDWEKTYSLMDPRTLACPMIGPTNMCSIYPTRPNCCVAFEAGSEQCQDARRMIGLGPLAELIRS